MHSGLTVSLIAVIVPARLNGARLTFCPSLIFLEFRVSSSTTVLMVSVLGLVVVFLLADRRRFRYSTRRCVFEQ